jgi:UDP-N-acetyl-D-mannosaminuronate dehydrogenase
VSGSRTVRVRTAPTACVEHFRNGQLVVLRSTVFPGVTALMEKTFANYGLAVDTAFCPERIAEGRAMTELFELPQIVAGRTDRATSRAAALFGLLTDDNFAPGMSAMQINEGLPLYLASRMESRFDLKSSSVGILGMAFKGGSDDIRSSLSYKLKRILSFKADAVFCSDLHVTVDQTLLPLEEVLERADVLVIATPHAEYAGLVTEKPVVDIWNMLGRGVKV